MIPLDSQVVALRQRIRFATREHDQEIAEIGWAVTQLVARAVNERAPLEKLAALLSEANALFRKFENSMAKGRT